MRGGEDEGAKMDGVSVACEPGDGKRKTEPDRANGQQGVGRRGSSRISRCTVAEMAQSRLCDRRQAAKKPGWLGVVCLETAASPWSREGMFC